MGTTSIFTGTGLIHVERLKESHFSRAKDHLHISRVFIKDFTCGLYVQYIIIIDIAKT